MADAGVRQLRPTLQALTDWLHATGAPHLIIGGVAVSLLGRARFTRDVDALALVDVKDWPAFLQKAIEFGFTARESDPLEFARLHRMLLLRHDAEQTNVDISLGFMPFDKECIERGQTLNVADMALRVPTIEDLIIMKAAAFRPVDIADIDTLLDIHPDVDRRRIRRWVRDFADTMDSPDIFERVDELLKAKRLPKSKPKPKRPKRKP